MKKRTKRILAMLLASAMILQQGSTVGVLATETEPVSETVAETTAAETMAQETQAPETTAETKAPETQVTETALGTTQTETAATEQTETAVPQTEQTETPAATEATEATETAAETTGSTEQSETTSQETTAQETTETPAQTEETTEVAEETATEKATEAATETEAPKTNFTYEDSRVIITAVAEAAANLPQDAQIHADYMAPGTAAYNEAAAALEAAYAGQDVVLDYVFYDIYFTVASAGDGRIEPEAGTVTVSMQFKKAELTPDKDVEVQSYDVVHVENGKAQEVPSTVQTTGDGSVASVGFTSDSFSPYGFVTVGQENNANVSPINLSNDSGISKIDLEANTDLGAFLSKDKKPVFDRDKNSFTLYFSEDGDSLFFEMDIPMTYDLPDYIVVEGTVTGVFCVDGMPIGTYQITNGKVSLTIDSDKYNDVVGSTGYVTDGYITFTGDYNKSEDTEGKVEEGSGSGEGTGGQSSKNPKLTQYKSSQINWKDNTITYKITVKAEDGKFVDVHVTDKASNDLELIGKYVVKIYGKDYAQVGEDKEYSSLETLQNEKFVLDEGQTLTIEYTMKIKTENLSNPDFSLTNSVQASGHIEGKNEVTAEGNGTTNDTEKYKWVEWVAKKGDNSEDQYHPTWKLQVGKGSGRVVGVKVKDTLDETQSFDKSKNITVNVYKRDNNGNYNLAETTTLAWEAVTLSSDGKTWEYTIPDELAGCNLNDPSYYVEFVYQTNISHERIQQGTQKHKNTAQVEGGLDHAAGKVDPEVETVGEQLKVKKQGNIGNIEQGLVDWEILITVPEGGYEDAVLKDTFGNFGGYRDHLVDGTVSVDFGTYTNSPSQTYTLKVDKGDVWFNEEGGSVEKKVDYGFSIFFNSTSEEGSKLLPNQVGKGGYTVTVKYQTQFMEGFPVGWIDENTGSIGDQKFSAKVTRTGELTVEKKVKESYAANSHKYEISVYGDLSAGQVVVTDTYEPTDLLQLDKDTLGVSIMSNNVDGHSAVLDKTWYTVDTSQDGKIVFTINLPKENIFEGLDYYDYRSCAVLIYYNLSFTDKALREHGNLEWTGENTVNADSGEKHAEGKAPVEGIYKGDVLKKESADGTVTEEGHRTVNYKLTLNPTEADLNLTGDTLTVQDTLGAGLEYLPGSAKITPSTEGDWYTYKDGIFTFKIPDKTVVTIEYTATVMPGINTVVNTAKVVEIPGTTVTEKHEFKQLSSAGGTIGVSESEIEVAKEWSDGKDAHTEDKVTVQLMASYLSGSEVVEEPASKTVNPTIADTKILSTDNNWSASWSGLATWFRVGGRRVPVSYTIKEVSSTAKGYTGSVSVDSSKKGKFILTNTKNTLGELTVTKVETSEPDSADAIPTETTYYDVTVTASKTDTDLSAVTVAGLAEGKGAKIENNKISFSISKNDTVVISNLPFDTYTVTETTSDVTFKASYKVDKTAVSGSSATVAFTADKLAGEVEITNTYKNLGEAELNLRGTKTLDGEKPEEQGTFKFKIEDKTEYGTEGAPSTRAILPANAVAIPDETNGVINIRGIKFKASGTYTFEVSEVADPSNTDINYDTKHYTVEVTVSLNEAETGYEVQTVKVGETKAEGAIVTDVVYAASDGAYLLTAEGVATFANTTKLYNDAALALSGTKTLDDKLASAEFTFKVEATGTNTGHVAITSSETKNDKNGNFKFENIKFTADGTYTLEVSEVKGTDTSIKYDSKKYVVKVTVSPNETTKKYEVTKVEVGVKTEGTPTTTEVTAVNGVYPLTAEGVATFANTTKAGVEIALTGTKTLNDAAPKADAFAFKAEATGTNKTDVTIKPATVKNGADGSFTFSSIKFAKAGTYTLEISEIPDNVGTVTYDKTSYIVTVTVKSTESGFEVESVKVGEEDLSLAGGSKYVLPKQKDAQEKETATFVNSTLVKLDKVDEDNKKVIGAKLQVVGKDADGKDVVIEGWTTNSDLHVITGKLELGKTYILKEVSAPKGYKLADPVEFKVGEDGKIYLQGKAEPVEVITMTDAKLHFNVNKTELGTGDEVEGAELTVYEKQADGSWKEVEGASWTSKKGETHDFGDKLEAGKSYKLVEKVAPEGYAYTTDIEFSVGTDGTITTSAKKTSDAQGNDTYLVEDAKLHFNVNKTELGTGDEVEGAELTVYEKQADGTLKKVEGASWTSKKGETHDFGEKLEAGKTYVLREEVAPDGYGYVTDIEFTVEKDGKITTTMPKTKDAAGNDTYLVEDARIRLEVDKRATGTGEELDGAVLELLDAAGNVVESWTSKKGETHNFGGKLKAGESYTLRETIAPDGYTCVTDMKFTVGKDGTVNGLDSIKTTDANGNTVYVVEDTLNKVSIQKVDESGAALAGAKLVIKDADGKAVASWTTDGKAHEITGLATGKYTLSEVEAPEGYQVSKDVPFEITGKEAVGSVIELSMTDTKIPESNKYSLTVTKHLHLDGITGDLAAKEATYYVALFSDEAKTQRVSNVKKIEFKNATSSTVTFDKLAAGTYYVGETDENGTLLVSKIVNDKLIFHPEYTDGGKAELEGKKTEGTAEFTNVYMELPSGFYLSGQITVTKKVLVNGAEGTSDETYYARVFSDKKLSTPASDVLALDLAGGTSASVTVTDLPIGESIDSSMNYYVAETDENGKPLDPDAVTEFEISIDKSEVVLSANNSAQEVVITNNFVEEETETETETETEVEKKEAPKTGDDTDFMRYLLLMAFSAGTCAIAFEEKRRRNRARK